jgi:hypothetical protein
MKLRTICLIALCISLALISLPEASAATGFINAPTYAVATSTPTVGVSGDFNNDGADDIVVLTGSTLSTLLAQGNGRFAPFITSGSNFFGYAITAGDFNGDGKLDVVVVGTNATIFLGTGTGSFNQVATTVMLPSYAYSVAVQDLNNDGKLDLVTANSSAKNVSVLF